MTLKNDKVLTFGEVKALVGKSMISGHNLQFGDIFDYDNSGTVADVDDYKTASFLEANGFKRLR